MNKIQQYFSTDWSALTGQDWAGLILTVVIFFGMLISFSWALRPKKKDELEAQKFTVLKDD